MAAYTNQSLNISFKGSDQIIWSQYTHKCAEMKSFKALKSLIESTGRKACSLRSIFIHSLASTANHSSATTARRSNSYIPRRYYLTIICLLVTTWSLLHKLLKMLVNVGKSVTAAQHTFTVSRGPDSASLTDWETTAVWDYACSRAVFVINIFILCGLILGGSVRFYCITCLVSLIRIVWGRLFFERKNCKQAS